MPDIPIDSDPPGEDPPTPETNPSIRTVLVLVECEAKADVVESYNYRQPEHPISTTGDLTITFRVKRVPLYQLDMSKHRVQQLNVPTSGGPSPWETWDVYIPLD